MGPFEILPEPNSWRATFDFFDREGTGTLTEQDLFEALGKLGQTCTRAKVRTMMGSTGCATTKWLDYEKYVAILRERLPSPLSISRAELMAMYDTVDLDLSGYLTAAKIRHFLNILNVNMHDDEMAEMVSIYDTDGNNQISMAEFELMLISMGYAISADEVGTRHEQVSPEVRTAPINNRDGRPFRADEVISLESVPENVREVLQLFDRNESGSVSLSDVRKAADLFKEQGSHPFHQQDGHERLHWDPTREKRGLGDLFYKANHIAIIVSDVGKSAQFYSNVLGLQQIRRPNFDKHGAWFTMGNVELHLIKGTPLVHSGDDLIVNHISLETYGIDNVPARLEKLGVPFRQNVSVPKGEDGSADGRTNDDKNSAKIVRQFFFRDPDGYYIEVCDCMLLTEYCLGKRSSLPRYDLQRTALGLGTASLVVNAMQEWARRGRAGVLNRRGVLLSVLETDGTPSAIGEALGFDPAKKTNEDLVRQFKVRQTVYGDICQTFSERQLEEIACAAGNDSHLAFQVMQVKASLDGSRYLQPPAFYESGSSFIMPPAVALRQDDVLREISQ